MTSRPDFILQCDKASDKAMQSLWLINRTFTHFTKESFLTLYKTSIYVHPHLEYCVPIWSPYLAKNIDKLEHMQQRSTKLVPGLAHLPYETRLQHLDLYSLYCHRQWGDLIKFLNWWTTWLEIHSSLLSAVSPEAMIQGYSSTILGSIQGSTFSLIKLLISGILYQSI